MISGTNRIVLNTLAAYGRSLITFPLNLIGARWVLGGLGEQDFGISNVVGGMIFFVTFINAVLSGAVSRYYAYAIGQGQKRTPTEANAELQGWFNATLSVHLMLPLLLVIGYPLFAYAVRHWLIIPPDRVEAAIWVLRFSLVTSILGFVNVPYTAMFSAHQWIVELSVYALVSAILHFIISIFVPYFSGDRLVFFAGATSAASVLVMTVQNLRVRWLFPAARVSAALLFNWRRIRELMRFVMWRLMSGAAYVARGQGTSILTNLFFGPAANAAYAIGTQLSAQAGSLSQNLINALTPAATTLEGSGDRQRTLNLAYRSCRFAAILVMLFAVPLAVEVDEVLILWLKNPPPGSGVICICMLAYLLVDKLTIGQYLVLMADGCIGAWQTFVTISYVGIFLLGWGLIVLGVGVYSVAFAFVVISGVIAGGNIYYARKNVGMSFVVWAKCVLLRVLLVLTGASLVGWSVTRLLPMSFVRLCLTTGLCLLFTIISSWWVILAGDERIYVIQLLKKVWGRFNGCFALSVNMSSKDQ